jgi:glycerol-3-phosphate dehydrogenase
LAFLNVHAALEVLPFVVDVMGKEMGWGEEEKRRQVREGVRFLRTMGLGEGEGRGLLEVVRERGWVEKVRNGLGEMVGVFGLGHVGGVANVKEGWGRAKFEPGEVALLKTVFERNAVGSGEMRIGREVLWEVLSQVPGYEGISRREFDYVLEEAGLGGGVRKNGMGEGGEDEQREDADFQEFVEICGNLKEVAFATVFDVPVKGERLRIPVEKSGGGI